MSEFIRVKDNDTGHEFTIRAGQFVEGAMKEIDKPALDNGGEPLPPKHKTTVAAQASARRTTSSGQKADQEES